MRILVTGGTGFLGQRLLASLRAKGNELVVTSRDAARARAKLGDDVRAFRWDYHREPFPAEALAGVEAVYHLMGENIAAGRWTARRKRELTGSRITSTHKLVAALPDTVTDFLCASAIGVYPGDSNAPFDEATALPAPETFMTHLCADWEAEAAQAASPSRRVVSMRIGLVFGETGMLAPLVPLYKAGLGGPIGNGKQQLPWVHVEDLVAMMEFVLAHRELTGPVNLVGPEPVPLEEFSRTLAAVLRRPHLFRVPAAAIKLALGEASALLLSSYNILPKKLTDAGFSFTYPNHRAAVEAVVRDHFS